jgi:hypothetical protein
MAGHTLLKVIVGFVWVMMFFGGVMFIVYFVFDVGGIRIGRV